MVPELHYQMIKDRVSELRNEAAAHRLAREAERGHKEREPRPERRHRSVFGRLRTS
ncbi:hypothetical protein [Thermostaphylospora chromogena]|uniref:Uncharacterized protein n=1 Tax=Thermostaphylospora chromogena TaxID=35622 RepID=A0A1H1DRW6_9ACTN|nr:hypothetical protein [Thermostaphylospora chromogena]SDQ78968.1 hypothetical protein SAMN04489764_2129 [Thermostaphylospora chromogena]